MKIKELRQITGLTQKKFSERFKIPLRTIQNWESGTNPTPVYTERLIEMQLILENEIEALRAGQLRLTSSEPEEQPKPEPQQQQPPQEESNTDTVQNDELIEKLSKIEIWDIPCEECIHGKKYNYDSDKCKEMCDDSITQWIYWEELKRRLKK